MKVILLVLTFAACGFSGNLISQEEIDTLFKKFILRDVSHDDTRMLEQVFDLLHRPQPVARANLEFQSQLRNTLDCILCRSVFAALFEGVRVGQSDDELTDSITVLCVALGIQSENVCRGAVRLNMPVLTHIIRNTPLATPSSFCGLILQSEDDLNACPAQDDRFDWEVELPAYTGPVNAPITTDEPLKIVLLTDAHIDPMYEAYGVADCDEPTCCRKGQKRRTTFTYQYNFDESVIEGSMLKRDNDIFLDLSKAGEVREARIASKTRYLPQRDSAPAGYWGDYRDCDTPIWAYDNVIEEISANHKDVDLVYYIGDSIDHHVWETTYQLITDTNQRVVDKMRRELPARVTVVPAIGNHEAQPTNQFAPSSVTGDQLNITWLYESLADKWGSYLTQEAVATMRERGELSMLVRPGLRVISVNNNVAYRNNWWLVYDPTDSKRHLDWLIEELYKAEQAGERVHILAHIPPGVNDLTRVWTREYNRIVNRFSETIAAEFNGHAHSDEFKIFYSDDGIPSAMAWGGGSATSYSYYNLNYKILSVDGATYELENMENYVYNLTEANLTPHKKPHWFQLYNFRHRFNLPDLTPGTMDDLVHRMVTDDKQMLDLYSAFYSKLSDVRWPYCQEECKLSGLCKTVITVSGERQRCDELRELFYSTK